MPSFFNKHGEQFQEGDTVFYKTKKVQIVDIWVEPSTNIAVCKVKDGDRVFGVLLRLLSHEVNP